MKAKASVKSDPSKKKGRANFIDENVGLQLRQRRALLGMSQERLAEQLGITFQQIQKYENGANRISASRLFELSKVLEIPVSFFFDGVGQEARPSGFADNEQAPFDGSDDVMTRKETLELVRTYYSIEDAKLRKDWLKMLKTIAQSAKTPKS